jgi:hypothetical protein
MRRMGAKGGRQTHRQNLTFTRPTGGPVHSPRVVPCVLCGRTAHRLVGKTGYCDTHTAEAFAAAKSRLVPGGPHGEEAPPRR